MDLSLFLGLFGPSVLSVIKAIILLLVAFLVAWIVKKVIVTLLGKTGLKKIFAKTQDQGTKAIEFIGRLAHIIVFLLFVPAIFELLGVQGVTVPINAFLSTVWAYLPNIIGAVIILWIGFFVAKVVRDLLESVLNKIRINKIQDIAGIDADEQSKLSKTIAYIVYILILIPIIIAALQVLNITAVSEPATEMLVGVIGFIPNIFVAVLVILIGVKVGQICGKIVSSIISAAGLDALLSKLINDEKKKFSLSKVVGIAISVVVDIFFIVEAFDIIKLDILVQVGTAIIAYLPVLLAAALILLGCFIVESLVTKQLRKNGRGGLALFARIIIYVIGIFMILSQLGIAPVIVNSAFVVMLAATGIAFAIAFGIGGKSFGERMLQKLEDSINNPPEDKE